MVAPALWPPSPRLSTCAGLWSDDPQRLHLQQLCLAPTLDSGSGWGLFRFPAHRGLTFTAFSFFKKVDRRLVQLTGFPLLGS